MTDIQAKRIDELDVATAINGSDLFVIEQSGVAMSVSGSVLSNAFSGGTVDVDDALSATSSNPVQNKVIKAALDEKVDAVPGKGLSANDYTSAEKEKLSGIEAGAQKNPDLSGYALKSEIHSVPSGGTAGQVLGKASSDSYDLEWVDQTGGGGGGPVTVDDTLSGTSENPVQNKVVKAAIDVKADKVSVAKLARKLKSLCVANISLPYEYNSRVADFKAKIDTWNDYGFDGYIVCLNAVWDGSNLTLREDMNSLNEAFRYIVSSGKPIKAFKLHCTTYDSTTNFKNAYYNLVGELCPTIKSYGCYRFIVLNECTLCLDSAHQTWIKSVLDLIGTHGMGRSISYDLELFGYGKVPSTVVNAMSWFCFNYYPPIGNKGRATTPHDYKVAWESSAIIPTIQTYKNIVSRVKEIWITETGVNDYYVNLAAPAAYNMDTSSSEASNGNTQTNYLKSAFDVLDGNVDLIAPWYSIDYDLVKDLIQKEMGVM